MQVLYLNDTSGNAVNTLEKQNQLTLPIRKQWPPSHLDAVVPVLAVHSVQVPGPSGVRQVFQVKIDGLITILSLDGATPP